MKKKCKKKTSQRLTFSVFETFATRTLIHLFSYRKKTKKGKKLKDVR